MKRLLYLIPGYFTALFIWTMIDMFQRYGFDMPQDLVFVSILSFLFLGVWIITYIIVYELNNLEDKKEERDI